MEQVGRNHKAAAWLEFSLVSVPLVLVSLSLVKYVVEGREEVWSSWRDHPFGEKDVDNCSTYRSSVRKFDRKFRSDFH